MGTNYYAKIVAEDPCPTCGRGYENDPVHIGKSSAGWCFALHVYTDVYPDESLPHNLEQWIEFWGRKDVYIEDEYGKRVSSGEMVRVITERSSDYGEPSTARPLHYKSWKDFYEKNHAERGPNNLLRHRVDGRYCIKHGPGTYDYCIGEFS